MSGPGEEWVWGGGDPQELGAIREASGGNPGVGRGWWKVACCRDVSWGDRETAHGDGRRGWSRVAEGRVEAVEGQPGEDWRNSLWEARANCRWGERKCGELKGTGVGWGGGGT